MNWLYKPNSQSLIKKPWHSGKRVTRLLVIYSGHVEAIADNIEPNSRPEIFRKSTILRL